MLALLMSQKSAVSIATHYGLDCPGMKSRWGEDFQHPFRLAYPASYTMDTGSLQGVKQQGHGVDQLPATSAEVKERSELYLYSP
jgi:hypothetical protein